jgi:nitrous oxidase accessory protein NosD
MKRYSLIAAAAGFFFAASARAASDAKTPPADACQFLRDKLADPAAREVVVPAGTYVCASPVVVSRSGVTLRGQGRPTLRLADRADSPLLILGGLDDDASGVPAPVSGLLVEGLILDGNRVAQPDECWGGPCDTGGTTGVRNNGLTLRGLKDSTVRDVEITGARSGGLVTERDCAGIHVKGLKARDSFFDGLSVNWTRDGVFENLELTGNAYAGLTMDVKVKGNVFRDGVVSDNRDVGVFLRRAESNRFERLTVSGNKSHGVYLSDADHAAGTCAENNVFFRVEASGNGRDGFHMDGACAGNRLVDSPATGNKGAPVEGAWVQSANP